MQWRIMRGISLTRDKCYLHVKRLSALGSVTSWFQVQYREYEYALLAEWKRQYIQIQTTLEGL